MISQPLQTCDHAMIVTADPLAAARTIASRARDVAAFRGIRPADPELGLKKVLDTFPVTDKKFYIQHGAQAYQESERSVLLFAESSGTSGSKPLLTPRGRTDLTWNTYNQSLAYRRHLIAGQDRVMLLNPSVMSPFIEGSARALYDLGVAHMRAFPIPKICDWARIGRLINDYGITAMMSTPTLILKLLFELDRLKIRTPSLVKLLVTGEHLSRPLLKAFDSLLGISGAARPLIYGSSEAASVMYGREDGDYIGYTRDFVFEILPIEAEWQDRISQNLPANAQFGRLAISWLRDGIMILVRFDTGDLFSCWPDPHSEDIIFRSHGRANVAGLSPVQIDQIEGALWAGESTLGNVVHYDLFVGASDVDVSLITRPEVILSASSSLITELEDIIAKKINLKVNPASHSFFEFSPAAKTNRFQQ
ncbi:hypothetical protein [Rhizobium skierniewicense]|uniref:hypothetical protein n=1 Tax=Rhizobium skierniewicense TaxID=984260 RepID=UPI001573BCF2|nr:hypothetical protein [Rhizobium skierniewicense]NTF34406.1 hypothetical protein [Rhizobium skierniewicense]